MFVFQWLETVSIEENLILNDEEKTASQIQMEKDHHQGKFETFLKDLLDSKAKDTTSFIMNNEKYNKIVSYLKKNGKQA